jgi:hypothetical protein
VPEKHELLFGAHQLLKEKFKGTKKHLSNTGEAFALFKIVPDVNVIRIPFESLAVPDSRLTLSPFLM